jgi:hypothetical protein
MAPQQRAQIWHTVITALAAGIMSMAAVLGGINFVMKAVISQEIGPVEKRVSRLEFRDSIFHSGLPEIASARQK